jgi:hypothetical protein
LQQEFDKKVQELTDDINRKKLRKQNVGGEEIPPELRTSLRNLRLDDALLIF